MILCKYGICLYFIEILMCTTSMVPQHCLISKIKSELCRQSNILMIFGVWWTVIDIGRDLFSSAYFRICFSSVLFESMILTSPLSHTPPLDSILSHSLFFPPSLTLLQLLVTHKCWYRKCAFSQASKEKDVEREERVRKSKAVVVMTCI